MSWDSTLYLKFASERNQPCKDLLSHLSGEFNRILDLGCGPGNSTEALSRVFGSSTVIGFDSDDNMLKKARESAPNIEFIKGCAPDDLARLPGKFDLIFSNACIHWIKEQERLLDELQRLLTVGGVLAVQLPLTDESPFYKLLYSFIERSMPRLKSVKNFHNLDQAGYYNALSRHFRKITMWQSNYYHVADRSSVIEWYRGSGLRPYLELLDDSEREHFLNALQAEINNKYPLLDDGKVFLIMPRLFFIAEK